MEQEKSGRAERKKHPPNVIARSVATKQSNHAMDKPDRIATFSYMYKGGTVYILSSVSKRVLYVGVTSDLERRIIEHKTKAFPNSFSARFNCCLLVYYRHFNDIEEAIAEEKRIKGGNRQQKEQLITGINPNWLDLSLTLTDWWPEQ